MENEKNNIKKTSFWNYVVYFTFYSVIGWCYEVFLEVVVYRWGFSNRGVLFGPYTPVYGVGALAFLLLVYPVIRNKKGGKKLAFIPVVFLLCMLIATAIELGTSYALEALIGSWPWQTYADYAINFQARIALSFHPLRPGRRSVPVRAAAAVRKDLREAGPEESQDACDRLPSDVRRGHRLHSLPEEIA